MQLIPPRAGRAVLLEAVRAVTELPLLTVMVPLVEVLIQQTLGPGVVAVVARDLHRPAPLIPLQVVVVVVAVREAARETPVQVPEIPV